jgi:nitroreductase
MSFLDLCRKRQSDRGYDPSRPVPREALERCLEAARLAPSACNSQPWEFIVVDSPELRGKLAATFAGPWRMNGFAKDAGAIVAIVRRRPRLSALIGGFWRGTDFVVGDLGIAGEHFVLQATEEGFGSCWIGWFNESACKRLLGLGWTDKIECLLTIGWPAGETREKKRKALHEMSRFI